MSYQSLRSLEELAAFVAVVDANGFSAAARQDGVRRATLSQRVQALEERLGVPLMVRSTRSIRLTEEGQAYLEHARSCLHSARQADEVVVRAKSSPQGRLRLTAPNALLALLFEEVVANYLSLYPDVSLELNSSSSVRDIHREDFDLAIRVGTLSDSTLVSRKLATVRAQYFASTSYLEKYGTPQHPSDLSKHFSIATQQEIESQGWPFLINGSLTKIHVEPRVVVDSCAMAMDSLVRGMGILYAPTRLIEESEQASKMVSLFQDYEPPRPPLHAVFAAGASKVPKVATFLQLLVAWCEKHERLI